MSNTTLGILFICMAMLGMSLNDVFIKMLAGDYPLHQMVLARSGIGIFFSFALVHVQGGWSNLLDDFRHIRFGWQALRAVMLIASNLMYFCAVAVMPSGLTDGFHSPEHRCGGSAGIARGRTGFP